MSPRTRSVAGLAAAVALLTGAVTATTAEASTGWSGEAFPQRPGYSSTISQVSSGGGATWAFGGNIPENNPITPTSQAYQRAADGTWSEVAVPDYGNLDDGVVLCPKDVWAIGGGYKGTGTDGVLHWDGNGWTQVPIKVPGATRVAASDVELIGDQLWVLGKGYVDGNQPAEFSFAKRWDGAVWRDTPLPAAANQYFLDKLGGAPNDLWAVGQNGDTQHPAVVTLHWDGANWTQLPAPPVDPNDGVYRNLETNGVAAVTPTDVWLSAQLREYDSGHPATPVLLHWNGKGWTREQSPVNGALGPLRFAQGTLWNLAEQAPLRYDGTGWRAVDAPAQGRVSTGAQLPDGRLLGIGNAPTTNANYQPFAAVRGG